MERIAMSALALLLLFAMSNRTKAQDAKTSYPSMAPLDQYLMERDAEIAMAKSAAPASISSDAEVLALGRHGFETAVKGKNGFVCVVERSWAGDIDDTEFWNPKLYAPTCFNPPAARTHLPITRKRTELALAGQSKEGIAAGLHAAFDKNELPAPERGSMCYMMSRQAYFGARFGHGVPHLMFYFLATDELLWGASLPGSPVLAHQDAPDHLTVFMIPVGKWSDGEPAPVDMVH
jgi:hypothetical protein